MIQTTVKLLVSENKCEYNKQVVLYRGDKNVRICFKIDGNRFEVLNSAYAQMIIKRPLTIPLFSEISRIEDDTFILVVTEEMINEINEIGQYSYQIRLFDEEQVSRATLPPAINGILIEDPITSEEALNAVGMAEVGRAMVGQESDYEESFDAEGFYNKTIWHTGDTITEGKLNKVEEAIETLTGNGKTLTDDIETLEDDIQTLSNNISEVVNETTTEIKEDIVEINETTTEIKEDIVEINAKNYEQDMNIKCLFSHTSYSVDAEFIGNDAKLINSKSGTGYINSIEGDTKVNVCDQKDPIPLTKSYTVETGNHVALEGEYDGKAKPYVYGNTLVNLTDNRYDVGISTTSTNDFVKNKVTKNECIVTINAPVVEYAYFRKRFNFNMLKPNTDYTLICSTKGVEWLRLSNGNGREFAINRVYTASIGEEYNVFKVTTNDLSTITEVNEMFFYAYIKIGYEGEVYLKNPILLEGDYTDKPIQYFEGLQSSFEDGYDEESGKYKVEYKVTGKNKFDGWEQGHINDLGELYDDPNSVRSNYIKVIPNTQYTFSNNGIKRATHISYYDERKQFIFTSDRGHPPSTFVMPSNCMYIRLSGENNDRDKFQLEEGSTATAYEPYKEYTKTLYLNSPLLEGDSIEVSGNDIVHVHRYKEIVLDGSEDEYWRLGNKYGIITTMLRHQPKDKCKDGFIISDRFAKVVDDIWNTDVESILAYQSDNYIDVRINKSKLNDDSTNGFKQWLANNPMTVVYELASPVYEIISTDEPYIYSYANGSLDFNSVIPIDKVSFRHNVIELQYLKPNTDYLIQFNSDNNGYIDSLPLGGASTGGITINKGVNKFTLRTPETIAYTSIGFNGIGCNISNIVVTEAIDYDFDYFEGLSSAFESEYDEELGKYKVEYKVYKASFGIQDFEFGKGGRLQ